MQYTYGYFKHKIRQVKERFDIIKVLGEILFIFIGALLAFSADAWEKDRDKAQNKKKYLQLMAEDVCESLTDLNRDLEGHQEAMHECLRIDSFLRGVGKADPHSLAWDFVSADFQFYPNTSAYESFKNKGFDLMNERDSTYRKLINLYEMDFQRLYSIGKEISLTRGIKEVWNPVLALFFTLSTTETTTVVESKNYTTPDQSALANWKKYKLVPRGNFESETREMMLFYLQKSNEIRRSKIIYYQAVKIKAESILQEIWKYPGCPK